MTILKEYPLTVNIIVFLVYILQKYYWPLQYKGVSLLGFVP